MPQFNFQNSTAKKIIDLKNKYNSIWFRLLRNTIYVLAVFSLISNVLSYLGIFELSLAIIKLELFFVGAGTIVFFFDSFLMNKYFVTTLKIDIPEAIKNNNNIADYFDENLVKVIENAFADAKKFGYVEINPIIILNSLQRTEEGFYIFSRIGAGKTEEFQGIIIKALSLIKKGQGEINFTDITTQSFIEAAKYAHENGRDVISIGDALVGITRCDKPFQDILFSLKIKPEDLESVIRWYHSLKDRTIKTHFWKKNKFGKSIGESWSFGYASVLSQFAYDMSEESENLGRKIFFGRDKEVSDLERILSKTNENSVLIIGDKGIGKNSLVEGLIARIAEKKAMPELQHYHIYKVDSGVILSGSSDPGVIEQRITMFLNDAIKTGNVILYFEDFHNLLSSKAEVGKINASEVFMPFLKGPLKIIATTNRKNFHEDIEANPSLAQLFGKIEMPEPSEKDLISILEETVPYMEFRSKVFFTYQDLKEVIRVSERYVSDRPFPQKAIDIIDEVAVRAAQSGAKIIDTKIIDDIVSEKTKVPVAEPEGGEKEKLMNLENTLHQKVIGQNEAIDAIANAMRRARSGLGSKNRPVGTFLFLGPTGVGKTETAKALAEAYFGSSKNMIRLDMSEFQDESSINRLIGSTATTGNAGTKGELLTRVKDAPFSLILFDEMEKANSKILTLFLQVFDEGYLNSSDGEKVSFKNAIIICTSNAGSELIREGINEGKKSEQLKRDLLEFLQTKGVFKPEFLNRFDGVIAFHPLTEAQITEVAKLLLKELSGLMMEKEITLEFTDKAVTKLAKIGFDPVYGARPMRRTIQEKVEDSLAKKLLSGEIKRGDKVVLDEKDIK